MITNRLPADCISGMEAWVTNKEIRDTIFSMHSGNAPGPDGFSASFFQRSLSIVGHDLVEAKKCLFISRKLLKEVSATIITLAPKNQYPPTIGEYRPISCCNVLY